VRAGIGNDTAAIFIERDPGDADRTLGAHVAQGVAGGLWARVLKFSGTNED
jgi:hypothetical protein